MRLFVSSLTSESGTPTPPIIDGGNVLFKMPDADGRTEGYGFTDTGLTIDRTETAARTDGGIVAWLGNDGREPSTTDQECSLVKILMPYDAVEGGDGNRVVATKLDEIIVWQTQGLGSIQGVTIDENEMIWFTHGGTVKSVSKSGVYGDTISATETTGLTYDKVNKQFYTKDYTGSTINVLTNTGSFIRSFSCDSSIDALQYIDGILYGSIGVNNNPSSVLSYDAVTGVQGATLGPYDDCQAAEGIDIFEHPDGHIYLYYANDSGFHPTTEPEIRFNMVAKIRLNP